MMWRSRKTGEVIEKNGTYEAPCVCFGMECDSCPAAEYSMKKYGGDRCEEVARKEFPKFMDIMGWEPYGGAMKPGDGHCCKVGILTLGIGFHELTMDQFQREMAMEPVMTAKKFKRFNFCPYCGREIDWGWGESNDHAQNHDEKENIDVEET